MNVEIPRYQLRVERAKLVFDIEIQKIGSDGMQKQVRIDRENT